ncbi:MAG TPA: hypothetical protein VHP30_02915, partial [Ignavibacteriales bacterium]|nr:hypothetical protein [Ignavibacteriales bacterium]
MNLLKLVPLLLILFLTNSSSFPQDNDEILTGYLKVLRPYTNYTQTEFIKKIDSLSVDSLKQCAALMYKAYENGAGEVTLAFKKIYEKEKEEFINPAFPPSRNITWVVQYEFQERFEKVFSLHMTVKINVPIYVKARIIGKRTDSSHVVRNMYIKYPEYNILIEDVLKGKKYSIGDTSWFYYMYHWSREEIMETYHVKEFKTGESYLLPLNTVYSEGRIWYALDGYYFYFDNLLIQDGYLYDNRNTFGMGEKVSWEEFKRKFLEDAEKIKSGKGSLIIVLCVNI